MGFQSNLKRHHKRSGLDFSDAKALTEQNHKASCDIHNIMKKSQREGIVSHLAKHEGTYNDYAAAPDFTASMNIIAEANSMFESVPAQIRANFHNDPQEFVTFMQDDNNYEKIEKMGLDNSHLTKPEPPAPTPKPAVKTSAEPSKTPTE